MNQNFISKTEPPKEQSHPALWFAFCGSQLLVCTESDPPLGREFGRDVSGGIFPPKARFGGSFPRRHRLAALRYRVYIPCLVDMKEVGLTPIRQQYLGTLKDQPINNAPAAALSKLNDIDCYSAELSRDSIPPNGMTFEALRKLYGNLEEDLFSLAGLAFQVMEWDRTHQYCGHCGTQTVPVSGKRAKLCPNCSLISYPRLSPAVIVLVERGTEILLARAHHFPANLYSILAGFVEPGESLEDTIIREIYEEARIKVQNIRYFGSQPWPYPNSLMIGFTATYASGEIQIDETELADAAWFNKHNLPLIPPKLSIARKLIDWFVEGKSV